MKIDNLKIELSGDCGINFDSFLLYVKRSGCVSAETFIHKCSLGYAIGFILGRKYAPEEKPLSGLAFFINFCFLAGRGGGGVLDVF